MRAVLSPDSGLSLRELKFLTLAANGLDIDQLGRELLISESMVYDCQRRICDTLGARNRTHAVALAYERGILLRGDSPRSAEARAGGRSCAPERRGLDLAVQAGMVGEP